jgi:hypothetical protein
MEGIPWKVDIYTASQANPCFYGNRNFTTVFRQCLQFASVWFIFLHPISRGSVLLVLWSCHLRLGQGCTNPGRQVTLATTFCTVVPNICGFSVWNAIYVTFWRLEFWDGDYILDNLRNPGLDPHVVYSHVAFLTRVLYAQCILYIPPLPFFYSNTNSARRRIQVMKIRVISVA